MEFTKEREISLGKLCWKLLQAWRRWMALGIVFAMLLSSYIYISAEKTYEKELHAYQMQQKGEKVEEKEKKVILTKEEMEEVEDVEILEKQIARIREYVDESIYMQLEPDNMYTLILHYYVDSDYTFNYTEENTLNYTSALIASYRNYAISGDVAKAIKTELNLDIDEAYIKEVILTEGTENTFKIKMFYSDIETLKQIEPVIRKVIEDRTLQLKKTIGSHKLELVEMMISSETDQSIVAKQKQQSDMVYNYTIQIKTMKNNLSEEQLEALGIKMEEEKEEEEEFVELLPEPVPPTFSLVYVILGFCVGAFLGCGWIVLEVLFATKVQESEDISEIYGVRSFGELTYQQKKKKLFSVVDDFILKLQNRNKKQLTKEQQIRMICSNLELACQKSAVDKLYFTGSEIEKMDQAVLAEIKKGLSSTGIQIYNGENISYDAKSLKEMAEVGYVVFVEQVGLSLYKEIEKEVKLARENSIDILGSIVIV